MSSAGRAAIDDLVNVVAAQVEFWGGRDVSRLHHPMLVHEFGATSVVIRDPAGPIAAYLFGFVTLERVGYVHLVECAAHSGAAGSAAICTRASRSSRANATRPV